MKHLAEDLLYFIWQHKISAFASLKTLKGKDIKILKLGHRNPHSGPDFLNAHINIGDTIWVGNVEMHIKSSDWRKHKHQKDKAYKNVILHVVYEHDKDIVFFEEGEVNIPILELKNHISEASLSNYLSIKSAKTWIPCERHLKDQDLSKLEFYKNSLLIERLEAKVNYIRPIFEENQGDFQKTLFILMTRYFGATANLESFEIFANKVNFSALSKYKNDPFIIESILFGQAGFLNEDHGNKDIYYDNLKKEYEYQKQKNRLEEVDVSIWKFGGVRAPGFPTARLAQLAVVITNEGSLFDMVRENHSLNTLMGLFSVKPSKYWENHFVFGKRSKKGVGSLSNAMKERLIINAIVPMKFFYFKSLSNTVGKETAIDLLEEMGPESNAITKKWKALGLLVKSAYDTQSLLQLKKGHCSHKKCLSCPVGLRLMTSNGL